MKDKPPTRESVDTARKIAERMRTYPAALPALPEPQESKPTDYERGFADHADFVKTWMREQANGILDKATSLLLDGKDDEYADHRQCEWAFRYVLERYNERNQAGLRKAAAAL